MRVGANMIRDIVPAKDTTKKPAESDFNSVLTQLTNQKNESKVDKDSTLDKDSLTKDELMDVLDENGFLNEDGTLVEMTDEARSKLMSLLTQLYPQVQASTIVAQVIEAIQSQTKVSDIVNTTLPIDSGMAIPLPIQKQINGGTVENTNAIPLEKVVSNEAQVLEANSNGETRKPVTTTQLNTNVTGSADVTNNTSQNNVTVLDGNAKNVTTSVTTNNNTATLALSVDAESTENIVVNVQKDVVTNADTNSENDLLSNVHAQVADEVVTKNNVVNDLNAIKVGENTQALDVTGKNPVEEITAKIITNIESGSQELNLVLTPKELGTINIKIVFETGKVSVLYACDNNNTRNLLMGSTGDIRSIIENNLNNVQVSVQEDGNLQDYLQQEKQGDNSREQEQQENKRNSNNKNNSSDDPQTFLQKLRLGLIDGIKPA